MKYAVYVEGKAEMLFVADLLTKHSCPTDPTDKHRSLVDNLRNHSVVVEKT